jgi:hypothetical protein
MTMKAALKDLRRAVQFFDRVKEASLDEKIAVGTDHWDWLEKAARRVANISNARLKQSGAGH